MSQLSIQVSLSTDKISNHQASGATVSVDFIKESKECVINLVLTDSSLTTIRIHEDALAVMLWLACNTGISDKGILAELLADIMNAQSRISEKDQRVTYPTLFQLLIPSNSHIQPTETDEDDKDKDKLQDLADDLTNLLDRREAT